MTARLGEQEKHQISSVRSDFRVLGGFRGDSFRIVTAELNVRPRKMKYFAASIVAIAVLYAFAARHPLSASLLPWWVDPIGGALIFTLPFSLLCRRLTRRIGGWRARGADLAILFVLVGVFWAISVTVTPDPRVDSPRQFWFRLTVTSWATVFLPFTATVAAIEWFQSRKKIDRPRGAKEPKSAPQRPPTSRSGPI
jgi:hypothetical protein